MNIYQKLLEIQKVVKGLGKDKATFNYKYVTGDKILDEVKPLMNRFGLLLKQEVLSIDNERMDYQTKNGQKSEILSKVMMRFTWIDTETGEQDVNLFGANGQNDWEKGLGSALTYAERYFLLKFFHIATDEDDIDNEQRKKTAPIPQLPAINQVQLTKLCKKISDDGMSNAECLELAKKHFTLSEQDIQIIEACVYINNKLENNAE
jgi:hypothetical protein